MKKEISEALNNAKSLKDLLKIVRDYNLDSMADYFFENDDELWELIRQIADIKGFSYLCNEMEKIEDADVIFCDGFDLRKPTASDFENCINEIREEIEE